MLFDAYLHSVTLLQLKVVHYCNFEMPLLLYNLMHNRCWQETKLYRCGNNSILSIMILHATSFGLRYSHVCNCFSFFILIELITERNLCICVSISLIFQLKDRESLMMFIPRWTVVIPDKNILTTNSNSGQYQCINTLCDRKILFIPRWTVVISDSSILAERSSFEIKIVNS